MRFRVVVAITVLYAMAVACADAGTSQVSPRQSTLTDPSPAAPVVLVDIPVPTPSSVVVAFGDVWVQSGPDVWRVSSDGRVLDRFADVANEPAVQYMGYGGAGVRTLAAGFDSLWTLSKGRALRLDPGDGHVLASIPVPDGSGSIAVGEGAVWVSCCSSGPVVLLRIDPAANDVSGHVDTGQSVASLAVGAGSVWVLGFGEVPIIDRIDPETLEKLDDFASPDRGAIWAGPDTVWVTDHGPGLARIDPASGAGDEFEIEPGPIMALVPFGEDALVNAGDLIRVSVASGEVQTLMELAAPSLANAGIALAGDGPHPVVWLTEPNEGSLVAVQL